MLICALRSKQGSRNIRFKQSNKIDPVKAIKNNLKVGEPNMTKNSMMLQVIKKEVINQYSRRLFFNHNSYGIFNSFNTTTTNSMVWSFCKIFHRLHPITINKNTTWQNANIHM